MQEHISTTFKSKFEEDVYKGITDFPKHLSSQYFYDANGDKLFQDIMNMPEYYLTNSEYDILNNHKEVITNWFSKGGEQFDLVELGAGDGKKTKILLEQLSRTAVTFNYVPIDISQNALDKLQAAIKKELPAVSIKPLQGTYFEVLDQLNSLEHTKKVILFLGSNIGNLLHEQAIVFLRNIQELMEEEDLLFVGFDQKKNPQTILDAYNDATGITEAFNKNILTRINRELGANFDLDKFLHWEVYDPESGTAKSYLVAKTAHTVNIGALGLEVAFRKWESIHMEISQKYDDEIVSWLAEQAGLKIDAEYSDFKNYYKNYIFSKKI
ncbi:L-histidine N(alpha)-methyltransferase [Muriicola sp. Z0-33]|uniref:L-histidine N(alpha)-methyltransferase n=1 Tax=Muriicola sp. Z0-33 TaxID=2816957 RepID=UPI0022372503|nr:L-histidine N(alpha)-methyltransferase [Muriicola sp. Z0-33]MCW5516123.1 L-histidine N(alpha)-methyltransferase [Muriicola sp. Z0-33]